MKVPRPPARLAPLRTTAAMLPSVYSTPWLGSPMPSCAITSVAPSAVKKRRRQERADDGQAAADADLRGSGFIRSDGPDAQPPTCVAQRCLKKDRGDGRRDEGDRDAKHADVDGRNHVGIKAAIREGT